MEYNINFELKSEKELLDSIDKNLQIIKTNSNKNNQIGNDCSVEKEEFHDENEIQQFFLDNQIINKDQSESSDSEDEDKVEEKNVFNNILTDLNKNIEININEMQIYENQNYEECQEILSILKKPFSQKNLKTSLYSPFKPLTRPKRVSLKGRVLSDIPDENESSISKEATKNTNTTNRR